MGPTHFWLPAHVAVRRLQATIQASLRGSRGRWAARNLPLALLAVLGAAALGLTLWAGTCGFEGCPTEAELRAFRPAEGGRILDREGELIGRIDPVRRLVVPLDRIPEHVRSAFIAVEDRRFREHRGIDLRSAFRALWRNTASLDVREGSSTITMQAARSAFLSHWEGERSWRRKLIELVLAERLEQALDKDRILELYLNVIYLGDDTYGVEAASRHWFGKSVADLSLAQAAALAALPRAPVHYDLRRQPARATERRDLVLTLMAEQGYITIEEAAHARRERLLPAPRGWTPAAEDGWAAEMTRQFLDSVLDPMQARRGDLVVLTTFDAEAQAAAERAASRAPWRRGRGPEVALVALDPRSGELRAVTGGREFLPGSFNRAVAAHRQAGSAFKPFVYLAALEAGLTPATLVDDEPVEIEEAGKLWRPANADDAYLGPVTLRRALARSANAATVRVSQAIGPASVVEAARRVGIRSPLKAVPSVALGSFEVTPLELAAAYAPFANGGLAVQPSFVVRVEDRNGKLLWESAPSDPVRVIDPRDAFLLNSMLQSAVDEGTGGAVRAGGVHVPMGGKTGTTNDNRDAWFVGFTPTLVAAAWVGDDARRPLGGQSWGASLAAPLWADFYRSGWADREEEVEGWPAPDGMVQVAIDAETGLLAGQFCPVTRVEWFRSGTEPDQECEEHAEGMFVFLEDVGRQIGKVFSDIFD